jgi:hypothetical protein
MLSATANSDSSLGSVRSEEQAQFSGLEEQKLQMYDIFLLRN